MVSPVRTLHLSAATEDDRLQWMSSLSHNIRLSRQHARSTNLLALYHNAKQYTALDRLLRKRLEIIAWLATHCTKSQLSILAPNLFNIYEFRSFGTACTITSYCLGIEVESSESLSTMFRSNSLGTKLLDLVLRSERLETSKESESQSSNGRRSLLNDIIPDIMNIIIQGCREDTEYGLKLEDNNNNKKNNEHVEQLNQICEKSLDCIKNGFQQMMPLKCAVCVQLMEEMYHHFQKIAKTKNGGNRTTPLPLPLPPPTKESLQQYIVMLLFLRLINPALMNPDVHTMYANISMEDTDNIIHIQQAKKYVAQVLQKVANGKRFEGQSNIHLIAMNGLIDRSGHRCHNLYQVIQARSSLMERNPATPPLKDDEAAHLYDDDIFDDLYNSLVEVHNILEDQPRKKITRIDSETIKLFPERAKREVGYDPMSAMIDLDVVLDSLGAPSAACKTRGYGGELSSKK